MTPASAPKPRPTAAKGAPISAADEGPPRGLGAVLIRNEFYRDGYRVMQSIAVMQAVVICALVAIMAYVIHIHQPENRYFATTEDGRLVPMVGLNEPNLSTPALVSWAAQAATEVMTFGFNDYRRRLQESSRNFTRTGWNSFTKALGKSRIIETVESQNYLVTAVADSAPLIVSEGLKNGRYQWIVEVPITVTYQAQNATQTKHSLVRMLLVRVPRLESASGVGIEQWIAFDK